MSTTWSGNPYNSEGSLRAAALPKVLFEECHKNCVEIDFQSPQTDQEKQCIKNCQEKTYQAFDMYMRVQYNFAKDTTWRDHIDISKYTGMEVEHGLNTANLAPENAYSNLGHFDPSGDQQNSYKAFMAESNRRYRKLKAAAFQ